MLTCISSCASRPEAKVGWCHRLPAAREEKQRHTNSWPPHYSSNRGADRPRWNGQLTRKKWGAKRKTPSPHHYYIIKGPRRNQGHARGDPSLIKGSSKIHYSLQMEAIWEFLEAVGNIYIRCFVHMWKLLLVMIFCFNCHAPFSSASTSRPPRPLAGPISELLAKKEINYDQNINFNSLHTAFCSKLMIVLFTHAHTHIHTKLKKDLSFQKASLTAFPWLKQHQSSICISAQFNDSNDPRGRRLDSPPQETTWAGRCLTWFGEKTPKEPF